MLRAFVLGALATGVVGFLQACAKLSRGRNRVIYAACAFPNAWIYHGCYDVFLFAPRGELAWISLACVLPLLFTMIGLSIRWSQRYAANTAAARGSCNPA